MTVVLLSVFLLNNGTFVELLVMIMQANEQTFELLGNGYVSLFEVTENFWRLSRTAKRFKILFYKIELTSDE